MRHFVLLMVLASCTNPDEILPVRGLVASEDPVEGQVVRLLRRVQPIAPADYQQCRPSAATPFKETQADTTGNYSFDLFRVEAESLVGYDAYCFRIDTTFASGAVASSDFDGIRFETAVGTLRDWRAEPKLENGVLFFEPPVPLPVEFIPVATADDPYPEWPTQLSHRAQVVTTDGGVVWQVGDSFNSLDGGLTYREPMAIDELPLEDFTGSVVLFASLREFAQSSYGLGGMVSPPPVELVSGARLAVSGTRTPISRGLPCPEFGSPCPFTDGDLTVVDVSFVQDARLELSAPASLSAIVLRGMEAGSNSNVGVRLTLEDGGVETSVGFVPTNAVREAGSFTAPLVLPDGGTRDRLTVYLVIPVDAGVVKGVTLHFPEGLSRLQEVSLFE